jgi:hypothetical protein
MRAGESENCENNVVGTEAVADVVKIESFPMGSGAASVARGLQTEPDMEARAKSAQARTCVSICVRENRKSFKGLTGRHSKGNAEGPELPHAASLPGGALPTGSTYPMPSISDASRMMRLISIKDSEAPGLQDQFMVQGRVTGWETQVVALHPKKQKLLLGYPGMQGLGKSCARQTCLAEGSLPLTTK